MNDQDLMREYILTILVNTNNQINISDASTFINLVSKAQILTRATLDGVDNTPQTFPGAHGIECVEFNGKIFKREIT